MPVRIVKDDANEEVLSDFFNFDNPQETRSNESQDNSWNDGNGNGGYQNNSNASSGLFSFLGSMAVDACISYAFNALWGSGSQKQSSQHVNRPHKMNRQDADDMLQQRLVSGEICVSLWAHAMLADGKMQQTERQAVDILIRDTVGRLFPHDIADQTIASSALQKRLQDPHSYREVVSQASEYYDFALTLYKQACVLIASDEALQDSENIFLANLAKDLRIPDDEVAQARSHYKLF